MMTNREELEHFALRIKLMNWLAVLGVCMGLGLTGMIGTMVAPDPWYWFWGAWDLVALLGMAVGALRSRRIIQRLDELEEYIG